LSVVAAAGLTQLLTPASYAIPFALFFAAVALSAWYGGWGPGLLAIILSAPVGNYFFLPPIFSLKPDFTGLLQTGVFMLVAVLMVWLTVKRQQAEAALFDQREQLRVTLTSIGDAVIATDAQGRITFMNAMAEALTGFSQAEAASRPIGNVFHIVNESSREPVESPVSKVMRTGTIAGLANHTILIAKDGREIPIDDNGAPIRDDQGEISGVVLVFRDITERRQAEATLRQNEAKLQRLVESNILGIIFADFNGRITEANNLFLQLTGYSREDLLAGRLHWDEMTPPEHKAADERALQELKTSGVCTPYEKEYFRKDGSRLPVLLAVTVVEEREGQCIAFVLDITARKREELAQQLLSEAGQVLASSLDYQTTLQELVRLPIPHFADLCVVNMVAADGLFQQVAAHADPDKLKVLEELEQHYPTDPNTPHGYPHVIRTGQAELLPEIPAAVLSSVAKDAGHLALIQALNISSNLCVPLIARGKPLGAMTLSWAESDRHYGQEDLALATELARRAALAVDNARLYEESRQLNAALEQRVLERTQELQIANSQLAAEIAERERAEESLAEERNLLRTLIDNLPDYIYVKDSQSRFIIANQATAQGLGVASPEELVGKSDFDLFSPELAAQYYADEQSVIASGQSLLNREETTVYPADERGWASTTTIPLRDQQGQVIGLVGISRNITERKQMEAELAEIQHRLVESLEQERIHQAQELHDGPVQELYTVSFSLSGLKTALAADSDVAQLAAAQAGIQQVIQMLRRTFTNLRPPALAPYGLEKAVLSHAEEFQQRHPELKLNLNLTPDGQELAEWVRMALFRIYREGLNNIVRHAQARQVWIEFSLDAQQAVLEIKDDGQGFEVPLRWVELARQGHLGLVGIAERAEAIGGRLQIISAPGAGTLIRVSVPRAG
jgi:PAS domain S-box-containing protein